MVSYTAISSNHTWTQATITYTTSKDFYDLNPTFQADFQGESGVDNGDPTLALNARTAWGNIFNVVWQNAATPTAANIALLEGNLPVAGRNLPYFNTGNGTFAYDGLIVNKVPGSYGPFSKQFTYTHELGHALGLVDAPPIGYSTDLTIMSNVLGSTGNVPTGPMILDIQAIHAMNPTRINYGYKNGNNDTYGDGSAKTWTIWDGGGTDDTITATSQSTKAIIDLRGGLNTASTDAYWSHIGSEWIAIAYDPNHFSGVVAIERALGGSAGDEIYGGGISNPELRGNGGNDTIWGDGDKGTGMFFGGDTIYGDAGNDTLYGDNGQNTLPGSSATVGGNDSIYGGSDNDKIFGEGANDTLYGEAGLDTLYGGQGADSISGGNDSDTIYGGLGGDYLYGDDGNDTIYAYDSINGGNDTATNYLYGGAGNDSLVGGAGTDVFDPGTGLDTINYGAGNDVISLNPILASDDSVNGGSGNDTFNLNFTYDSNGAAYLPNYINWIGPDDAKVADDDNHFQFNSNLAGYTVTYQTYPGTSVHFITAEKESLSTYTYSHDRMTISGLGDGYNNDIVVSFSSHYDDLNVNYTFYSTFVIKDVGKDIANFGNDLVGYLVSHNLLNYSNLSNGDFSVDVGNAVVGTSAAEPLSLNENITDATGLLGGDRFIATNQSYSATIQDFSAGQGDKIDVIAFDGSLTTYASLNVTGSSNAVVTLPNGSTVTLIGVGASSLSAADFLSNTLYYGTGSVINGTSGNDMLYGTIGNDTIYCNAGNDLATGHMGNDVIYGWTLNDSLWGGYGQDTLAGDDGDDQLNGDSGNDSIFGGAGADALYGADGNDTVNGDADNDTVYGGAGNDSAVGGAGADSVFGDSGNDTVGGGTGNDTVYGWTGNDNLFGGGDDDLLLGDAGSDYLAGEAGNDGVYGGDGVDTVVGGAGNDWLEGGLDNDYFTFANGSGNDTINGFDGEGAGAGDIIYLSGVTGFANFAALQAVTAYDFVNSIATINLGGGNIIYVNGVTQAFASNDFGFA